MVSAVVCEPRVVAAEDKFYFVLVGGEFRVRLVTPRECARLMGADDFKISATLNQALFGFGDAVCVPVIQWIAENYLNPLLDEFYPDMPSLRPAQVGICYVRKSKPSSKAV